MSSDGRLRHLGSRSAPAPYQVLPPPVRGSHARACFSLGHEIGVADFVSCFFQELVLLTQLADLCSQFRDLSRLRGFLAVLVGGVLFPVPGDPVTHRLGYKTV